MNNTRKAQQLRVTEVKPGDYPLGSMESRAAARALLEKREEPTIKFRIIRVGAITDVGGGASCDSQATNEAGQEITAPMPSTETPPLAQQQEQSVTSATPKKTELESSEKQSAERWAQFVGSRRRPLVRKPPYRRHRWPPSAFGA